ncbi:MAG: TraR/DksA C4-type zinc finger protein [Patescibacteria group bacterium]
MSIDQKTLDELKTKLTEEKERLEEQLSRFAKKTADGEYKTDFPEDIGSEQGENASEVEDYTDKLALEQSLEPQLKAVLDALERMEQGTYGKDEETGEDIDVARLQANPAARTNISKE